MDPSIQKEVITAKNLATETRTEKRIDLVLNKRVKPSHREPPCRSFESRDSYLFLGGLASYPAQQGDLQQALQRYCSVTGFVNAETRERYELAQVFGYDLWVRSQRSELRSQKSEVRSQRSELRGQRSEVRGQRSEVRGQKSKVSL